MTLYEFRTKLKALHGKSKMEEFCNWPFVFDEDEDGRIFVNSAGDFFFSDTNQGWVPSHLTLDNVSAMRFSVAYEEPGIDLLLGEDDSLEPSESVIIIYFLNGDCIWLWNGHNGSGEIDVSVTTYVTEENRDIVQVLHDRCHRSGPFSELRIEIKQRDV